MRAVRGIAPFALAGLLTAHAAAQAPVSRVDLPIEIPLDVLRASVEARTPPEFSGSKRAPIPGAALSWRVVRGPIALAGDGSWIEGRATLTGAARVEGVPGGLGRLLDGLGRVRAPLLGGIDARVHLAGSLTLRATPRLRPDWRIDPDVEPRLAIDSASIPLVAGVRLDVSDVVADAMAPQMTALKRRIDALGETDVLERAAREAWTALCAAHPVPLPSPPEGAAPPPLWLILRPVEATASQPDIDAEALTTHVGVAAEARLADSREAPDCGPLPPLVVRAPAPGVSLALRVAARHETLSAQAEAHLLGRGVDLGAGTATAIPRAVRISGAPGRLRAEIDADVTPAGILRRLVGTTAVAVRIMATPVLDADGRRIVLRDSVVEARLEDWLNLAGWIVWAAQGRIVDGLEAAAVLDLEALSQAAAAESDRLTAALNEGALAGVARVEAEFGRLDVVDVVVDAETLAVEVAADGRARLRVVSIPAP
jgi:hypothetical protein